MVSSRMSRRFDCSSRSATPEEERRPRTEVAKLLDRHLPPGPLDLSPEDTAPSDFHLQDLWRPAFRRSPRAKRSLEPPSSDRSDSSRHPHSVGRLAFGRIVSGQSSSRPFPDHDGTGRPGRSHRLLDRSRPDSCLAARQYQSRRPLLRPLPPAHSGSGTPPFPGRIGLDIRGIHSPEFRADRAQLGSGRGR